MVASLNKPTSKSPRKPARPKHLPHGRWLGDFEPLSDTEQRLVECCRGGDIWTPDGFDWENPVRPTESTIANRIRATLIRFLALGGDVLHPIHEAGVMIDGAWITDTLDLQQCHAPIRLALKNCHFEYALSFQAAHIPEVTLSGSHVPGLQCDFLRVKGSIFLDDAFTATGPVKISGAEIGGDLSCVNGNFRSSEGSALRADGLRVGGDVIFSRGFTAVNEVKLLGAIIGGDLVCNGGSFSNENGFALSVDRMQVRGGVFLGDNLFVNGMVRLIGSEIGGDLALEGGTILNKDNVALHAQATKLDGGMIFRNARVDGSINLSAVSMRSLVDDGICWTRSNDHILVGLHYDRIIGPLDAETRIAWLKSQRADQLDVRDWSPQPWEQLIKVLREMGHPGTAAEIAMEKQRMMRKAGQIGTRTPRTDFKRPWRNRLDAQWAKASNAIARIFHDIYGILAGYGHRPMRIAAWMVGVWLFCGGLYWAAADGFAAIGPADPTITSVTLYPDAERLCGHGNEPGKTRWTECPGVPDEYSTFQPFIYSLDVILPLIDLQQEVDWAPIAEGPTGRDLLVGVIIRWVMWFEILFGWLASLMFVAIVSRLVDKD